MALPADLPTRHVVKTFLDQVGVPKKGPIDFELLGPIEQASGINRVDQHKTTTMVLSDGQLDVQLIASGNSEWTSPIAYKVTERLTNGDGTAAVNPLPYFVVVPPGTGAPNTWTPVELPPGVAPNAPTTPVKGDKGDPGQTPELGQDGTNIQWRYVGEVTWRTLVALATLRGPQGLKGDTGDRGLQGIQGVPGTPGTNGTNGTPGTNGTNGTNGRNVELSSDGTNLRWRLVGDTTWSTLTSLASITGPQGPAGNYPQDLEGAALTARLGGITIDESSTNEDTTNWPNRLVFQFRRFVGGVLQAAVLVMWHNEYGEIRGIPAKINTIFFRYFEKNNPTDTNHDPTVPIMEGVDNRTDRVRKFGLFPGGNMTLAGTLVTVGNITTSGQVIASGAISGASAAIAGAITAASLSTTGNIAATGTVTGSNISSMVWIGNALNPPPVNTAGGRPVGWLKMP